MKYYTETGKQIFKPEAYANTGAPMYKTKNPKDNYNINEPTTIYIAHLEHGKKYIGKTKDLDRRCKQHFSGNGSKVTKKFSPHKIEELETVHGFFSDDAEQYYTDEYIKQYGYDNVRGGNIQILKHSIQMRVMIVTLIYRKI